VDPRPLTKEEEIAISDFIKAEKEKPASNAKETLNKIVCKKRKIKIS
jgi:hypothetical protein